MQDIACLRAKRHPGAQFVRALRDRIGHDAVDADAGQNQRQLYLSTTQAPLSQQVTQLPLNGSGVAYGTRHSWLGHSGPGTVAEDRI